MQIFVNANYDFLKWRLRATALFLLFIAVGTVWAFTRGLNLGIDFTGGASIILRFRDNVPLASLREQLPGASIQQYGRPEDKDILIRLPQQNREGDYAGQTVSELHRSLNPNAGTKHDLNFHGRDRLAGLLRQADPDKRGTAPAAADHYNEIARRIIEARSERGIFTAMNQVTSVAGVSTAAAAVLNQQTFLGAFNLLNQETVGPQVGSELQTKALLAIILSTLAMGAYVAVRFDLKFGVAAIIGLAHDVAFTFAFMALVGAEVSLITVAAFLMVIGYSINDKVVIYDRVRENLRKMRTREDFETVLNRSLNQTLSRTILTGGCVLLILLSLIFFGGSVIHDFALLLFVGTVIGTLSTLTVVPAVVVGWHRRLGPSRPAAVAEPAPSGLEQPRRARKAS
jgi:preprotein translocase subunit SecF